MDEDFVVLSGDDGLTLPFIACGAKGVISVASNLLPEVVSKLVTHALSGNTEQARSIHLENYALFTNLFCEPNPVPVKTVMHLKGILHSPEVRLPLTPPSSDSFDLLEKIAANLSI